MDNRDKRIEIQKLDIGGCFVACFWHMSLLLVYVGYYYDMIAFI